MTQNDKLAMSAAVQSTPSLELEHQIMNSDIPKNEREWWAAREIERLRTIARELSDVLYGLPPTIANAEHYRRVGDCFYADPDYFKRRIEDDNNAWHEARKEIALLQRQIDPIKKQIGEIDAWIDREFSGYGRALRARDEPPLEGEPWMSMKDAKDLTRRAVAEFAPNTTGR